MNICICTYVTFKINNGSCLKHKKGRHSYESVCYQAYVTRMRSYVTMYPNYYPYDNNHHHHHNNNNHDKKAWGLERRGGGGGKQSIRLGRAWETHLSAFSLLSQRFQSC